MRRINFHRVIQFQKLAVKTVIHHPGHCLRSVTLAAGEVRPPDIADKQRVASQHFLWFARNFRIDHQHANALGRVAGRFHDAQFHPTNAELIAVFDGMMRKRGAGFFAKDDLSAGTGSKLAMAADEIRMQMGFDDVLNG